MKKVSIIIPAYKRAFHTKLCLNSIFNSKGVGSDFSLEVIVSDNSPGNDLKAVIDEFKDKLDLKYLHEKKPIFVGESRKRGVAVASGEILIFADSDIEVTENAIKKVVECFNKTSSAGMVTTKVIYKKDNIVGEVDRPRKEDRRLTISSVTYQETNYGRFLGTYKKLFDYLGGYDSIFESRGEGVDMSCRYWRAGFPIVYEEKAVVYHHHDAPDSLTRVSAGPAKMFASLILMTYKYGMNYQNSPSFVKIMNEGRDFQDKKLFDPVLGASEMLDWFVLRYDDIGKSKKLLPKEYDFKPQEAFTDKVIIERCISNASKRIARILKG